MRHLSLSEARAQLPTLADEVARTGEPIVVTRRGRPVMKLVPCDAAEADALAHPLRGLPLSIAEDFDEPMDVDWEALQP